MKLAFLFSGEHETLPKAELKAVLSIYFKEYKILYDLDSVLVIETESGGKAGDKILDKLERLSLTKAIYEFYGGCDADINSIRNLAREVEIEISGTFCVRIKRIGGSSGEISCLELEREIGGILKEKNENARIELDSPDNLVQGILSSGRFILGRRVKELKVNFDSREPQMRPFFHPSTMKPKMAKFIVNLARAREGDSFFDPFCGAGGILIEAGLVGAEVYGMDIDKAMAEGCRRNLEYFGIKGKVEAGDAAKLGDNAEYREYFDAVGTDPPYGRSASTKGEEINKLYKASLKGIFASLKKGKFACMLSPSKVNLEEHARSAGFSVEEVFLIRAHKSLIRKIVVLRKS